MTFSAKDQSLSSSSNHQFLPFTLTLFNIRQLSDMMNLKVSFSLTTVFALPGVISSENLCARRKLPEIRQHIDFPVRLALNLKVFKFEESGLCVSPSMSIRDADVLTMLFQDVALAALMLIGERFEQAEVSHIKE